MYLLHVSIMFPGLIETKLFYSYYKETSYLVKFQGPNTANVCY